MTKICESFAAGFAGLAELWIARRSSVAGVLHMQKKGMAEIYGRFMGGSERNTSISGTWTICAIYANRAKPHKHWRFRILLIWRVGT